MRVLVLQHIACEPPGVYEDVLHERGAVLTRVELDEGEALPDWREFDAIVAMGGPMGAYEDDLHPWLVAEKRKIAEAVAAGTPYWGVCLGVQLLAASLGARVYPGAAPEVGILPVELTAVMERSDTDTSGFPNLPVGKPEVTLPDPLPEAADELAKLTQYYYNVVYLVPGERESAGAGSIETVQRWLADHKFPLGYVLMAAAGSAGAGAVIDRFKQEGWTTLKSGVGRSRAFAEAFLERRLEVVLVPEPPKGDAPRKAKVAKDWKDVRKLL